MENKSWDPIHLPLGDLFSFGRKTTFPGSVPEQSFLHHSLPSFDNIRGPKEQSGSEIESLKFVIDQACILVSKLNPRISRVEIVEVPRSDGIEIASTEYMVLVPKADRAIHIPFYGAVFGSRQFQSRLMAAATGTTGSHTRVRPSEILHWPVIFLPLRRQQLFSEQLRVIEEQEDAIATSITKLRRLRRGALLSAMAPVARGNAGTGWNRLPLKQVVPVAEYGISEALDKDSRGTPVLRMNNLEDGRPELSDLRYSPVPVASRLMLRCGDVLFNRTNSIDHIGKSALWQGEIPEATFASYLVRINPEKSRLLPEYLVEWLMHPVIRQRIRAISTVAVQQVNVNPTRLRELEIDMPIDVGEQRRIVETLQACDEQIEKERAELAKLRTLKDGLVDELLADPA